MIKVVPTELMELITNLDKEFHAYSETFPFGPEGDNHWECSECHTRINEDSDFGIFLSENNRICQHCADTNYVLCELTHSYNSPADMIEAVDATAATPAARASGKKIRASKRALGVRRFKLFTCPACGTICHGNATGLITTQFGELTVCKLCADTYSETMCSRCNRAVEASGLCGCSTQGSKGQSDREFTAPSERMSQRFVGLELETMRGESQDANRKLCREVDHLCPTWGWKGDGSVDGLEFVSPKMGGGVIERDYTLWYEKAVVHKVGIEHYKAGYHVHVDARDIYAIMRGKSTDWVREFHKYGHNIMLPVAQAMVSPRRRNNHFCCPAFAVRGGGGHGSLTGIDSMASSGYPAVAIRSNTFEFRAFPSTSNPNYHLSRIEVAQRLVDKLHELLVTHTTLPAFREAVDALVAGFSDKRGTDYLTHLQDTLGLSDVSMRYLAKIHHKWNAEQYGGATKHNTDSVVEEAPTFSAEEKAEFNALLELIKSKEPTPKVGKVKKLTKLAVPAA